MKNKKISIVVLVVLVLAVAVSAVAAHGGNRHIGRFGMGAGQDIIGIAAEQIGLTTEEVIALLRDGATLTEVITENGGSVDSVRAAVVAALREQINAALADGRLTQSRADALLANLETAVTRAINNTHQFRQERFGGRARERVHALGGRVTDLVAELTGLEANAVRELLRSGATLADILTDNGVTVEAFVDAAAARAETRLSEAAANGRLTQAQADSLLQKLREGLTQRLNKTGSRGERA